MFEKELADRFYKHKSFIRDPIFGFCYVLYYHNHLTIFSNLTHQAKDRLLR